MVKNTLKNMKMIIMTKTIMIMKVMMTRKTKTTIKILEFKK